MAKIVAELARFGLEGRHLRAFRTAAERETRRRKVLDSDAEVRASFGRAAKPEGVG